MSMMGNVAVVFLSTLNGQQFFAANGEINYGGNIYTYLATTLTAANTYSNYTGGVLNQNPIAINSDGYLNEEIWIPEGTQLRVRIVDGANNLLQDIDAIPGVNDFTAIANIAYTFGNYLNLSANGQINFRIPQTASEYAVGVVPSNTYYQPYDVRRYGADPMGIQDSTQAIWNATLAGNNATQQVTFGNGGIYVYTPNTELILECDWLGGDRDGTEIQCNVGPYQGDIFRVTGHHKLSNFYFNNPSISLNANAVHVGSTVAGANGFTGDICLEDVIVTGFNYGIKIDETFIVDMRHMFVESCNVGFYCAPNISGGGYVTTHNHYNCYYSGNKQGVIYNMPVNSSAVNFYGGAIEDSTSTTAAGAAFTNIFTLNFNGVYTEGYTGAPAFNFFAVAKVQIDQMINEGGPLQVTASNMSIKNYFGAGANGNAACILMSAGSGTVSLYAESCSFPAGNNILTPFNSVGNNITLINTTLNSQYYGSYSTEAASLFGARSQRQVTYATAATANVYRFTDYVGDTIGAFLAGRLYCRAEDTANGANSSTYIYELTTTAQGGTSGANLSQIQFSTRGNGGSINTSPFAIITDANNSAMPLVTFTKNTATTNANVSVLFQGLLT